MAADLLYVPQVVGSFATTLCGCLRMPVKIYIMEQHTLKKKKLNIIILPVDEEEWFLFHTCINGFTDMWNLNTKPNLLQTYRE